MKNTNILSNSVTKAKNSHTPTSNNNTVVNKENITYENCKMMLEASDLNQHSLIVKNTPININQLNTTSSPESNNKSVRSRKKKFDQKNIEVNTNKNFMSPVKRDNKKTPSDFKTSNNIPEHNRKRKSITERNENNFNLIAFSTTRTEQNYHIRTEERASNSTEVQKNRKVNAISSKSPSKLESHKKKTDNNDAKISSNDPTIGKPSKNEDFIYYKPYKDNILLKDTNPKNIIKDIAQTESPKIYNKIQRFNEVTGTKNKYIIKKEEKEPKSETKNIIKKEDLNKEKLDSNSQNKQIQTPQQIIMQNTISKIYDSNTKKTDENCNVAKKLYDLTKNKFKCREAIENCNRAYAMNTSADRIRSHSFNENKYDQLRTITDKNGKSKEDHYMVHASKDKKTCATKNNSQDNKKNNQTCYYNKNNQSKCTIYDLINISTKDNKFSASNSKTERFKQNDISFLEKNSNRTNADFEKQNLSFEQLNNKENFSKQNMPSNIIVNKINFNTNVNQVNNLNLNVYNNRIDVSEDNITYDDKILHSKTAGIVRLNDVSISNNENSRQYYNFHTTNQSYRNDTADKSVDSFSRCMMDNNSLDATTVTKNLLTNTETKASLQNQQTTLNNICPIEKSIKKNIDILSRNEVKLQSADNMKFEKELNNQLTGRKSSALEEKVNNNDIILHKYSRLVLEDFELQPSKKRYFDCFNYEEVKNVIKIMSKEQNKVVKIFERLDSYIKNARDSLYQKKRDTALQDHTKQFDNDTTSGKSTNRVREHVKMLKSWYNMPDYSSSIRNRATSSKSIIRSENFNTNTYANNITQDNINLSQRSFSKDHTDNLSNRSHIKNICAIKGKTGYEIQKPLSQVTKRNIDKELVLNKYAHKLHNNNESQNDFDNPESSIFSGRNENQSERLSPECTKNESSYKNELNESKNDKINIYNNESSLDNKNYSMKTIKEVQESPDRHTPYKNKQYKAHTALGKSLSKDFEINVSYMETEMKKTSEDNGRFIRSLHRSQDTSKIDRRSFSPGDVLKQKLNNLVKNPHNNRQKIISDSKIQENQFIYKKDDKQQIKNNRAIKNMYGAKAVKERCFKR